MSPKHNITLSPRLRAAAGLVRPGAAVADVGCDHGKLSAFLLQSGKTPYVYGTDIRPGPLSKARELIVSMGLEDRCSLLLTDGLQGVDPSVEDVVIAGMGPDTSAGIIDAAPWLRDPDKRLILVPASKHERMRRSLACRGFRTLREEAVLDRGRWYTVILCRWDGEERELGITEAYLGCIDMQEGQGVGYRSWVTGRMAALAESVDDPQSQALADAREFLLAVKGE